MQKEKKKKDLGKEEGEELNEDAVTYQLAISAEWVEGLMQRIQQSLISNTPLIMCEKDLDVLDFVVLATSVVEPKAILARIGELKQEAEKAQKKK